MIYRAASAFAIAPRGSTPRHSFTWQIGTTYQVVRIVCWYPVHIGITSQTGICRLPLCRNSFVSRRRNTKVFWRLAFSYSRQIYYLAKAASGIVNLYDCLFLVPRSVSGVPDGVFLGIPLPSSALARLLAKSAVPFRRHTLQGD